MQPDALRRLQQTLGHFIDDTRTTLRNAQAAQRKAMD